jgi:hypothetical protein
MYNVFAPQAVTTYTLQFNRCKFLFCPIEDCRVVAVALMSGIYYTAFD